MDLSELSDVVAAAAGDSAAFGRLYRRHVGRIRRVAQWTLGTPHVEDVVQEAFLLAWRKLHLFERRSAFSTWLGRLATHVFLRARTQATRREGLLDRLSDAPCESPPTSGCPDQRVDLERAVEDLPERARLVFVLHDVQGFLHREIADLLGISEPTSRSQLSRARLSLCRHLDAKGTPR